MSSLASVFNSCSTLFTVDVYKKLRPDSSEKNLVRIGQIATAVAVIIGIIWIPIMQNISGVLYEYLQKVQSYIAPPITAVFLLGIFIKRVNKQGAFYTLISGLVIATLRIVLELVKDQLDPQGVLYFLGNLNYLVFGAYFFLLSIVLLIVISLLTAAPRYETIENLTFSTLTEEAKKSNKNSYNYWDIIITISVVLVVGGVMYFFNGS